MLFRLLQSLRHRRKGGPIPAGRRRVVPHLRDVEPCDDRSDLKILSPPAEVPGEGREQFRHPCPLEFRGRRLPGSAQFVRCCFLKLLYDVVDFAPRKLLTEGFHWSEEVKHA